jgi:hypothetical protein
VTCCQIERIVRADFRGTGSALFQTPRGYFLCEVWFENEKPKFQIRSNAVEVCDLIDSLETASIIAIAIQMAIEWATAEIRVGGNRRSVPCSLFPVPCEER